MGNSLSDPKNLLTPFIVSNQPRQMLPRRSGILKSRGWQFCCLLWRTTVEGAFDVIVVGLGAIGSATTYHLSKQHTKVLGLEALIPANDEGSSHGESRIIRQAFFEDPAYVPLVLRAYGLWDELQNESTEECIRQHLRCASKRGADLRFEEPVLSWKASPSGDGVSVATKKQTYQARSLVIFVGPWFAELVPNVSMPVIVFRRVMFWLKPTSQPSAFDWRIFPIFIWGPEQGPMFYGFPRTREADDPKVGIHSGGEECTPSTIDRVINECDEMAIRSAIRSRIPALNGEVSHAATFMYTMTPDGHFIIDAHLEYPQVSLAAGFSGHGFKFSSVVGEILSDLVMTGETSSDIALFSGSRFRLQ
jgi:glycine/D-amino acid oxidase-like deaminating enzyme